MKGKRVTVSVQKVEVLPRGRIKVKIKETEANLIDLKHKGKDYVVLRNLGRGRYVMREVDLAEGHERLSV